MNTDIVTKEYLRDPTVFADLFNTMLYNGEEVINPKFLEERNVEKILVENDFVEHRYRDIFKICKEEDNQNYVLLGIESQSHMDKSMPIRILNYDAMDLIQQAEEDINHVLPVVTLVILFAPDKWDGPRSLEDIYCIKDKRRLIGTAKYELNLVSPYDLNEEQLNSFNSEIGKILSCIKYSKQQQKLDNYLSNLGTMSKQAVRVLNETIKIGIPIDETKEDVNVCLAMELIKQECELKGKESGIKVTVNLYKKLGTTFEATLQNIANDFELTYEEALKYTKKYWINN